MAAIGLSTAELQANAFKRGQRVKVVDDLPGVPAGTPGKISMANGFTWTRYWVRFENGAVVGHIDHSKLVRAKDYERFLVARDREAIEAERAAEEAAREAEEAAQRAAEAPETAEADAAAPEAGGDVVINGVTIPAHFLEKAAAARARLGG